MKKLIKKRSLDAAVLELRVKAEEMEQIAHKIRLEYSTEDPDYRYLSGLVNRLKTLGKFDLMSFVDYDALPIK